MPTVNTEELLTPEKAAPIIGVTERRVQQYCEEGRLGMRIGRGYFITPEQARNFEANPTGRPKENRPTTRRPSRKRKPN